MDGYRACGVECIEHVCMVNPPVARLSLADAQQEIVDPPVKVLPSVIEVWRVVAKLNCGKVAGICGIAWELLKEGGEPLIQGLLVLLSTG